MAVGKSIKRVDAYDKVTGRAKYTDDLAPANTLVAKLVHSSVANGVVKSIDISQAEKVPGVIAVYTCFDVPQNPFPTAGHVWSTEKARQDIADKLLLTRRVRVYGDDIAVVVAEDEIAAERGVKLVKVEYDKYPVLLSTQEAIESSQAPLHEAFPQNILKHTTVRVGEKTYCDLAQREDLIVVEGSFATQIMKHGQLELISSFAYMENGRIIVVSSTQIDEMYVQADNSNFEKTSNF